jgi:predicted TIM-barrel fold metal-dependent hydrolase
MHLVDTHQHLWDLERFPYSWCASVPALNRSFRLADYAAASQGLDITKTLFMEADVDDPHALAEAEWIQQLSGEKVVGTPPIAGIIASGRPEESNFRLHLAALSRLPAVRGIRRVLHTQPDEVAQQSAFAENLKLLPDFGYTFDLCVLPRQLPIAARLIERCPGVSFILDHCGIPDVRSGVLDPWRKEISRIANFSNVVCKISGLVAYADPLSWTVDSLRPWVNHVITAFGWDRVLWGSDWPVCTLSASLGQWVHATHQLTAHASLDQRAAFFHSNAERIYRL